MKIDAVAKRLDELLTFADKLIATNRAPVQTPGVINLGAKSRVSGELFQEFRSASLSFLKNTFGSDHVFYVEFSAKAASSATSEAISGRAVLKAAKQEIDGGWAFTVRGLLSAEIFTDFLEMASHLLQEGYKDPAAVMIGSVLEEHLRQLCITNGIEIATLDTKSGKDIPKKADRMNNDLASVNVYNKLYQKNILGWLDLRNKAAHGKYAEYDAKQVELMEAGVVDFIAKTS